MKKDLIIQILLGVLVFIGISYSYFYSTDSKYLETKLNAEKEIVEITKSFNKIIQREDLDLNTINIDDFKQLQNNLAFDLFVFKNNQLIFWDENKAIPDLNLQNIGEEASLISLKNGYYIALKKEKDGKIFVALSLLRNSYSLVNKYLNNDFSEQFNFENSDVILPPEFSSGDAILSPEGNVVFKISHTSDKSSEIDNVKFVISILIVSLFWVLTFLVSNNLDKKYKNNYGLLMLFLFGLAWFLLVKYVPFEFKKLNLFSPSIYGGTLFSSIGILICFIIFQFTFSYQLFIKVSKGLVKNRLLLKGLSAVTFVVSSIFIFYILKSIVLDSVIIFSPENLTILNNYAIGSLILAFFILCTHIFYTFVFLILFKNYVYKTEINVVVLLLILSGLFALGFGLFSLVLFAVLFLFLFILSFLVAKGAEKNVVKTILVCLLFIFLTVSSILKYYSLEKEEQSKNAIVLQNSEQRDLTAETSFEKIEKKLLTDEFIKDFFSNPLISYSDIYNRINTRYFDDYFKKYDIKIIPFNLEGNPIKSNRDEKLEYYYNLVNKFGEPTLNVNLHFILNKDNSYSYLALLQISNNNKSLGTLAIELDPKKNEIGNVYPELLLESKKTIINQFVKEYDYAIYYDKKLTAQSGSFSYPFDIKEYFDKSLENSGYNHSFYRLDIHMQMLISSKKDTFFESLSIYTFLLSFYLIFGFILIVFYFRITYKKNEKFFNFSFRKKISIAMLSLVILSFLVIGAATVSYFSEQYNSYHQSRLIRKQKSISNSLLHQMKLKGLENEKNFTQHFKNSLNRDIVELSNIHRMDINIFNKNGVLLNSSQKGIFTSGLLSNMMNPNALISLKSKKLSVIAQEENIGNLKYLSAYVPIYDTNGNDIAYLNIPYFAKEKNLNQDISHFMISLINVYVLLLLIASILAFFISNSITKPLSEISAKFQEVTLTKKNKKLKWESDDEIGVLVKEYNRMIDQLEESAGLLASSERNTAWREMAKQIAHEIKNPLTPMKLSIQHLQRAIKDDPVRSVDLASRVSKTLIEQIDNLADIATAFSSFAKMPKGEREVVNIVQVLDSAVDLFNNSKLDLVKDYQYEKTNIYADQNQMISVFNNLVKNAIQAIEEKDDGKITVTLWEEKEDFLISIRDNGVGISDEKKDKVFVPNFTTKSSGTGLGLAISKRIIDGINGKIWLESIEDVYTVFYVKIPKHTEK